MLITTRLQNTMVFYSQHIFQLNIGLAEWLSKNRKTEEFLKDRIFISCSTDSKVVVKRIESRNQKTRKGKYYGADTDTIIGKTRKNILRHEVQVKNLKKKGANVIELDTSDDLDVNCKRIHSYIKEFILN